MRKLLFIVLLISFHLNTQAQMFFEIGLKGGCGGSVILSKNVMNDNVYTKKFLSMAYSYGGKFGIDFNEKYALLGEFMMGEVRQGLSYQSAGTTITKNLSLKGYSIPVLFRYNSDQGSFLEIGPRFSFIQKATQKGQGTVDVTPYFEKQNTGGIFGFGTILFATDNLYSTFGFRFDFGLTDILSSAGGKNTTQYYPVDKTTYDPKFTEYSGTYPVSVQATLELIWDLGYFAKSKCKRNGFIMF